MQLNVIFLLILNWSFVCFNCYIDKLLLFGERIGEKVLRNKPNFNLPTHTYIFNVIHNLLHWLIDWFVVTGEEVFSDMHGPVVSHYITNH